LAKASQPATRAASAGTKAPTSNNQRTDQSAERGQSVGAGSIVVYPRLAIASSPGFALGTSSNLALLTAIVAFWDGEVF
jgi:hypothetical protein